MWNYLLNQIETTKSIKGKSDFWKRKNFKYIKKKILQQIKKKI